MRGSRGFRRLHVGEGRLGAESEALPVSGRASARVLSAAVAGIQVLDVVHAVVAVPARLRLGGGVGR